MNGNPVGRLELILEGSRNLESEEWTEYSFRFKPGNPNTSPSIIGWLLHQIVTAYEMFKNSLRILQYYNI